MRSPFLLAPLAAQVPLLSTPNMSTVKSFDFKRGGVFTPNDLVSMTRPGAGKANAAGDLVLVPVSKFDPEEKKNHKAIWLAPVESSTISPFEIALPDGGDTFWLDQRTVGHVVASKDEDKHLELYAIPIEYTSTNLHAPQPVLVAGLPTSSAGDFVYNAASGLLVFSDSVYPDGELESVKEGDRVYKERGDNALVYDSTYMRHWDTWLGPKKASLFVVSLAKKDETWVLGSKFRNVLKGTGHSSPVAPFGGSDDFDVSGTKILYTAKCPKLPEAWHTRQNVYIVDTIGGEPKELTSGKQGATHGPVFNAQGSKAAWLELDLDGYEADRAKIVVYDLEKDIRVTVTNKWDRSAESLAFSKDGDFIYLTAGDHAMVKVYVFPVLPTPTASSTDPELPAAKYAKPVQLTDGKAASGLQVLSNGRILFSQSSLTSPNDVFILSGLESLEARVRDSDSLVEFKGKTQQVTHFTAKELKGKNLSVGENVWFKGAEDKDVQGWVLKPNGFEKGKKYPVVFLIHGGPQGAWQDAWSNRWNPNVFAAQGYFAVAINPTGSTSFGQDFTDAITEDWGGKPFVDLRAGWKHVLKTYPEIDAERAVAAGASWGGYAINWINGHPEYDFGFKAMVCHDGVFDASYNGFSTDELFFFKHDWGGSPWEPKTKELIAKYSPSNFVQNWKIPQLLIHGSKDYRLADTESIGAFHALQQLGVPSRLVIFPTENHWVLDHGNSLKWHYEVFRWFNEFVGEGA